MKVRILELKRGGIPKDELDAYLQRLKPQPEEDPPYPSARA